VKSFAASTLRAAAVAVLLLVLAWSMGGQARLGRIDPALALPLMPLPALLLAWLQRREARRGRWRTIGLAAALLLVSQAGLALALSAGPPWLQLGVSALGWSIILFAADALARWRRGRAITLLLAAAIVTGWFVGGHWLLASLYRPAVAQGPAATMLTGLPLRWSGGTDLSAMLAQGANDDTALVRLGAAGPLRLVDSLIDDPPAPGGALLLAHPRALAPRELVAVDVFVRGGGRAVILADALTAWPMRHPLGDPRNPPVTSLLTPLLDHWGVTLGAAAADSRRAMPADVDGARLRLVTAGRFETLPPTCRPYADRHVARCRIGQGDVWLVGDADLLFAPLWQSDPEWADHLRKADTAEWLGARLWPDATDAALQPLWIRGAR
jgi:hypothetical protein